MSGLPFRPPVLITAPTEDVVSLEEAKTQLRVTSNTYDDMIEALIAACVQQLDPAGGGWLGRALRPQTWELRLDGFPYGYCGSGYTRNFRAYSEIELPYPPLIEVVSFKYDDGDGVEQTLVASTDYRLFVQGSKSVLRTAYNGAWPSSVRCDADCVRVRYTAGHDVPVFDYEVDTLPQPIKQAVLLMVRQLWALGERNLFVSSETVDGVGARSYVVTDNANVVMRTAAESLLATYRVWD